MHRKSASWKKKKNEPRTAAQESFCVTNHIVYPDDVGKVELSVLIDIVIASRQLDNYRVPKHKPEGAE
jgi:hypothetical protein